ncbi:protein phosphatase 2C domain-containing protein [Streptomyces polygonati]|uniref:Protein phosphatase 2C domain-containing protein n=1 Tax=Streptomyces polygonati TaxID=1617087 RepID=A0ABV8HI04_9ACTN
MTEEAVAADPEPATAVELPDAGAGPAAPDEPAAEPAVAPEPVALGPRFPEPVVLVGRPSLGSAPRALPQVTAAAPDSVVDGGTVGGLVVRGASIRGDDHRYFGETRQDAMGFWTLNPPPAGGQGSPAADPVLLACVADGVGSQPLSQLGSSLVCRLLPQHTALRFDRLAQRAPLEALAGACRAVASDIAAGIRVEAAERRADAKELSAAMAAALVFPGGASGPARALLFAVGDCQGFLLSRGVWRAVLGPAGDDGDIMSTATDALPGHPDRVAVAECALESGDVLLLCTDGLANPMRNDSVLDRLAQYWGAGHAPALPEFYWQLSFRAQTFGDDRSAVCVWVP